jgi:putative colanic acid biosynthesis acetyltransferase WcaF
MQSVDRPGQTELGTELEESFEAFYNLDAKPKFDLGSYDQSDFDRGRSGGIILLWWLVQAVVFPLTLHSMSSLRARVLRFFGAKIGQNVIIRPTARFTYPWKVEIGDYSWIGDDVVLYSLDRICIGHHAVISQKTYLCTGSHDFQTRSFDLKTGSIQIGNGVWVAADCFVGPGVVIGANSIVGTRSTVLKSLASEQVCWGNPCKAQRDRNANFDRN